MLKSVKESLRAAKGNALKSYFRFRIHQSPRANELAFRSQPLRTLFILSHMRSGSSLLTHILTSNPEIVGYGETQLKYCDESDIQTLTQRVYHQNAEEFKRSQSLGALKMDHRYILDKLLHGNLKNTELLKKDFVYSIILLREPRRTLKSILDIRNHWSEERALEYYLRHLNLSLDYVNVNPDPQKFMLVTYQQIMDDTAAVMTILQRFLGTEHPFSERYSLQKTSGQAGVGDAVGHIRAGQIVRQRRKLDIEISEATLTQAERAFEETLAKLAPLCTTVN